MFPAVDQPNLKNQKTLHARLHVPVPHIPGLVYRYNSLLMEIRNRDTCEIHLEVLDAEKDKLRLDWEYIKLKMKKKVSADLDFVEMQKKS